MAPKPRNLVGKVRLWVTEPACGGLDSTGQFNTNGIFLAEYQQPALSFAWLMFPTLALWVPGRPLHQIMPCRLAVLAAIFLWVSLFFSQASVCVLVCPSGSVNTSGPSTSFVCFFSFCLNLHRGFFLFLYPQCFCFLFCLFFSTICVLPFSFSLPLSLLFLYLPWFLAPSSVVHLFPCLFTPLVSPLSFLSSCILCFLIFFYLSCLNGGLTETQTHRGAHRNTVIHRQHTHTYTHTCSRTLTVKLFKELAHMIHNYIQAHAHYNTVWLY